MKRDLERGGNHRKIRQVRHAKAALPLGNRRRGDLHPVLGESSRECPLRPKAFAAKAAPVTAHCPRPSPRLIKRSATHGNLSNGTPRTPSIISQQPKGADQADKVGQPIRFQPLCRLRFVACLALHKSPRFWASSCASLRVFVQDLAWRPAQRHPYSRFDAASKTQIAQFISLSEV
jgi:hypothetical protein